MDCCHVDRLNLLQLAPGGHLGRFVIWTASAFKKMRQIYGTQKTGSSAKKGWRLPRPMMTNTDITRIINSDEVQSVCRAPIKNTFVRRQKKNPLKNKQTMLRLNPYSAVRALNSSAVTCLKCTPRALCR